MSANSQVARNQSRQTFDSVYESTNPLTTLAGQRMVEWFTGNSLNTDRWTLVNNTALPTVAMQDSVDGGLLMTNTGDGSMTFNDIKQYGRSCSCVMVIKNTTTSGQTYAGLCSTSKPDTGGGTVSTAVLEMGTGTTYMNLVVTDNGSSWDRTATSVVSANADWHTVKIDVESTSVNITMNGVLDGTRTLSPSTAMQPCIQGRHVSGANATTYLRYFEAWNN